MSQSVDPKILEKLLEFDSPSVANGIERFGVRSRRDGFMGPNMACRFPDLGRAIGYAVTCTIVDVDHYSPPDPQERFAWLEAIQDSPKPVICVVQDLCRRKGWYAHWGEVVGTQVQVLGATGIVTDGAVRDLEALHAMGMKIWSEHVVVSHGEIDVGTANCGVTVSGLNIQPGDLLHADCNGVVKIPHQIVEELPEMIGHLLEEEQSTLQSLRANGYDLETHRRQLEH